MDSQWGALRLVYHPHRGYGGGGAQKLVQLLLGPGASATESPWSSQTQSHKAGPQASSPPSALGPEEDSGIAFSLYSPPFGPKEMWHTKQGLPSSVPHSWLERNFCPLLSIQGERHTQLRSCILLFCPSDYMMWRDGVGGCFRDPDAQPGELRFTFFPLKSLLHCLLHPL